MTIKNYKVTITVDLGDSDINSIRRRILHIPFGDHDMGFSIDKIEEGAIDPAKDETLLKEYREIQGCTPITQVERHWG